ncbi:hypothetical protein [Streptacidiphilus cavernicola]|uniref:Uncharacterized protein n=1 Tax=Streptacidiphilus cavernicola TaxID=3342716 RepID=A0ABV6VTH0_9ACTN
MPTAVRAVTRGWGRLSASGRLALSVFLLCQAVLLVHWAAFYPALYSPDSFTYVWQVSTGNWVSDHSIAYDALIWLSLKGTGSVAVLTLLQTLTASLFLADIAVSLHRIGVRARWTVAAAVAAVVMPSMGTFMVFLWKDVPYVLFSMLVFSGCIRAGEFAAARVKQARATGVRVKAVPLDRPAARAALWRVTAGFTGILVFRNNGYPAIIIIAVGLLLLVRGLGLKFLVAGIATTVMALVLTLFVYPAVGVKLPHEDAVIALNVADIAVAYKESPSSFTPADLKVMEAVAPLSHWKGRAANCWDADWAMAPPMNRPAVTANGSELLSLWSRVLTRTPQDVIGARLCRSQIAWGITSGPKSLQGETNIKIPWVTKSMLHWTYDHANWSYHGTNIKQSPYYHVLKKQTPLSDRLNKWERTYSLDSATMAWQWFVWRGAIWAYLCYALVLRVAWVRRSKVWLTLLLPTLGLQLTVIAANPAQVWRYMAGPLIIGVMSLPLATVTRRRDRALAASVPEQDSAGDAARDVAVPGQSGQEIIATGQPS